MAALVNDLLVRNPDAPFTNRTIDSADTLELDGIDVSLTSGANLVVNGNLTVQGTTTTVNSETVNIDDNYLYLNNAYTADPPETGGIVVNVDPDAGALVAVDTGGFVAGVPATSNPTVTVAAHAAYATGLYIQVSGTPNGINDGIYEVLSDTGTVITIRGVGLTATVEAFTQNQFTADATVQGSVVPVGLAVLRANTSGAFEQGFDTTTPMAFTPVGAGSVTLQTAYENGNTITTDAGNGSVIIAGTESLQVTATGGLDVDSIADFDVSQFDVDVTGAGFSLDANLASNVTVAANDAGAQDLTLSATNAGAGTAAVLISADDEVDITTVLLDANVTTLDVDATGAASIDAALASNFSVAANDAGPQDLTLSATNAGAGTASVLVSADDEIDLTTVLLDANLTTADIDVATAQANAFNLGDGTNEYINADTTVANPKLDLQSFVNITEGGAGGPGIGVLRTTDVALVAGDCVGFAAGGSGNLVLSDGQSGVLRSSVCYGVSRGTFAASATAQIYTVPGSVVPVRTVSALAASNNGRYLFVSATAGQADISPPGAPVATRVIFIVGILLGADGVTTTPDTLFAPQFQNAGASVVP